MKLIKNLINPPPQPLEITLKKAISDTERALFNSKLDLAYTQSQCTRYAEQLNHLHAMRSSYVKSST